MMTPAFVLIRWIGAIEQMFSGSCSCGWDFLVGLEEKANSKLVLQLFKFWLFSIFVFFLVGELEHYLLFEKSIFQIWMIDFL